MKITVKTPTRIDLAGGTLDIYPLYLFEEGGLTVNIAISLYCEVILSSIKKGIIIEALDIGEKIEADNRDALPVNGNLDLLCRAVKFYGPENGINIKTRNTVPKGSGLGASSSLLMALSAGLLKWQKKEIDKISIIDIGANLEAQVINIPTGKQDYYAALFGGINAIYFNVDGIKLEPLVINNEQQGLWKEHLILSYTEISHFSGTHNWDMFKKYIDGDKKTKKSMKIIKETAFNMKDAVKNSDFKKIAKILSIEWENRKNLADGVTNEKIDNIINNASKAGAYASKICGAGGGGCMITIAPPSVRNKVEDSIIKSGGRILPFEIDYQGLKIDEHK